MVPYRRTAPLSGTRGGFVHVTDLKLSTFSRGPKLCLDVFSSCICILYSVCWYSHGDAITDVCHVVPGLTIQYLKLQALDIQSYQT